MFPLVIPEWLDEHWDKGRSGQVGPTHVCLALLDKR